MDCQLNCKNCNKIFYKNKSDFKRTRNHFCSRSCSTSHNNKGTNRNKPKIRICKYCKKTFTRKNNENKIFCKFCIKLSHSTRNGYETEKTRFCSFCKEHKMKTNFHIKKYIDNKKIYHSYCKKCFSKYCNNRWVKKKLKAIEYKGGKCLDCKQQYPYQVYDFHHLDPNKKEFNWDKLRLRSFEHIKKELEKCVLLCSNCHRIRHIKY